MCGAPWGCSRSVARGNSGAANRPIADIFLCRPCYQYVWEKAKVQGRSMVEVFPTLPPPREPLSATDMVCERKDCGKILVAGSRNEHHRRIGLHHVCRACYQAVWEFSQQYSISMEEALAQVPSKDWYASRPKKERKVKCLMPWCEGTTANRRHPLSKGVHVCGDCSIYLKKIARRYKHRGLSWQEWGVEAITRGIIAPGMLEICALPWCRARVIYNGISGPEGEPICNTDSMYLRLYARRNGISRAEAFATAPPPERRGNNRVVNWPI